MQAYLNDPKVKKEILAEVAMHRKHNTIVHGSGYWNGSKGCAVGCLIKSSHHIEFEARFGIPVILATLYDRIFENLPEKEAEKWFHDFPAAIKTGADLSSVWPKFAVFMLVDKDFGVLKLVKNEAIRKYVQQVADLYQRVVSGEKIETSVWRQLWQDRPAGADAAADAADAAADAARKRERMNQRDKLLSLLESAPMAVSVPE